LVFAHLYDPISHWNNVVGGRWFLDPIENRWRVAPFGSFPVHIVVSRHKHKLVPRDTQPAHKDLKELGSGIELRLRAPISEITRCNDKIEADAVQLNLEIIYQLVAPIDSVSLSSKVQIRDVKYVDLAGTHLSMSYSVIALIAAAEIGIKKGFEIGVEAMGERRGGAKTVIAHAIE
jgi:hypothetical protein